MPKSYSVTIWVTTYNTLYFAQYPGSSHYYGVKKQLQLVPFFEQEGDCLRFPLTDSVAHKKLWTVLNEMSMPQHLIVLMNNLYFGQEINVRTFLEKQNGFPLAVVSKGVALFSCMYMQNILYEKVD